jgi:hypothetical protein
VDNLGDKGGEGHTRTLQNQPFGSGAEKSGGVRYIFKPFILLINKNHPTIKKRLTSLQKFLPYQGVENLSPPHTFSSLSRRFVS